MIYGSPNREAVEPRQGDMLDGILLCHFHNNNVVRNLIILPKPAKLNVFYV